MLKPTPSSPTAPLRRLDALLAATLAALAAAAYIRTLYPGVLPNDGAEFQALAHLLGTAHTTGYAVYLLLAKLVTFLPLGDVAYRVNLFSALMGSATVGLVYLSGVLAARSRWAAAVAALALGLSATFWSQAVIAEVYTPASAILAAVIVLLLAWYRARRDHALFWAGLLGGLSLGVHGSVALAAPAAGLLVLLARPSRRSLLCAAGGVLLGAALMSAAAIAIDLKPAPYSIFEAAYRPAISAWDRTPADIATPWQRFVFNITAVQWRPAMFADPARVMPAKAGQFAATLPKDYAWPVLALMLLGAVYLFIRDGRLGLFALAALLVHNLYTFNYNIGDNYVFYIPGYVYLALLSAAGAAALFELAGRLARKRPRLSLALSTALGLALLAAVFQPFVPSRMQMLKTGQAVFAFTGIPTPAETRAWYANIRATAAALEPNAIVYAGWGDVYAYTYAAWIDLGRSDLRFIEPTPYSKKGGMAASMLEHIRANLGVRPQYFAWRIDRVVSAGIRLRPRQVGPTQFYQAEK